MKVDKNTTLEIILEQKGAEEILAKHGVPCVSCPMAAMELSELKIGNVCKMYGLKLDAILKDLNNGK